MFFEELPTETITNIFLFAPTVSSAVALSSTCHRFRKIFSSSKKLSILNQAAENQYGPLHDVVQLVTYNASQPAHLIRDVPLSEALLQSAVRIGRIAARWEAIYPFKKWKADYINRHLLNDSERYILRRALYRLWLFTHAFHNRDHPRTMRVSPPVVTERAALLHNFSTGELAEMLDVQNVMRETIGNNVCPSNGAIRRKFQKRYPESNHQLLFNIHLNYGQTSNSAALDMYHHSSRASESKFHAKYIPSRQHEPGAEGWGDEILHYYVLEDMLKLDPEQILYLRDNCPYKSQVENYTANLGEWFNNNGETFCQTLAHVVQQRGGDMEELRDAVRYGSVGIAVSVEGGSMIKQDKERDICRWI